MLASNLSRIVLISILLILTGCMQQGTKIKFSLASVQYLNPDIKGNPSPLVVSIYQLKSAIAFKKISYNELIKNTGKSLGTNLIDKQDIEIKPNMRRSITQYITSDTTYIGVAAGYQNIDRANWRSIITVPHTKKKINLGINFESQGLQIKESK